ncbi:MAG: DNA-binding transcriptional regulator OxyR [Flavobacteriaceae bacterium]|nr:DNA-binding transcriptional regulator OxyR [Flavobacteriaceae bacterium]
MTIIQLRYMLLVAEHKNFTIAANKAFVTQPTLSIQIQKLEEELGAKIFNRNTKPVLLTEIGEKIVEQAQKIIEESSRMTDIVAQEKGFIGGEFKLGILPTVMPTLLPKFLYSFIKKYPKVDIKIEELTTSSICKKINDGHLDAGIVATPLLRDNIIEKSLYYEPFVGYVPSSYVYHKNKNIEIEDLNLSDLLILEDGHCFRNHVLNLCEINEKKLKRFDLKSGGFETLIHLADAGLGMTILPYLNAIGLPKEKQINLKYFKEPAPAREISLIHSKSQLKLSIISALKSVISEVLKNTFAFGNIKVISPTKTK